MFNLKGRVAVVTGASSGLGLQMAHGFANQGADLVIMARRIQRLEEAAKDIREKYGVRCLPIQCDVTDTDQVNKAAAETFSYYGRIDILVNNAGASRNAGVLEMTDEDWNFTLQADLTSVFKVTRAFAKYMVQQNYGRIINIASIYGQVGNTAMDTVAYHSSKGGVVNFTRAVAAELAKYNITCNAISPGYFETELTADTLRTEAFTKFMEATVPLRRYGREGELNAAAVFLASDEASYITGQNIKVDGGYTSV
ncbi:MAG: SDR family NAD(P)-dependent oxidoreductase [Bacillota bacterium]|jgi:NAD(P)-dependent dehydrogenase (short-subunit alcohol dehydrogenase family)|nr:SDR family oxidoreductase [Bacillota bacterium]HPZ22314.1 SDR family oxidoreductase [Bacillota bacterium]HQD19914.1 SDR family oxidoreductase [Bacillota bacterium]